MEERAFGRYQGFRHEGSLQGPFGVEELSGEYEMPGEGKFLSVSWRVQ